MTVKERKPVEISDVFSLMKDLLNVSTFSKIQRTRRDILFRLAADQALRSFEPEPGQAVHIVPVGIYLDTTNPKVIKEANAFWVRALAEEGFAVIAELEGPGSWFKIFLPGTRDPKAAKEAPSKFKKHAEKFLKKFEGVVKIVVFGSTILTPIVPHQPPKPPTEIVMPAPEAKDEWGETFKQIGEMAEKADKIVGGPLAIFELAKKKKKNGDNEESDD